MSARDEKPGVTIPLQTLVASVIVGASMWYAMGYTVWWLFQ